MSDTQRDRRTARTSLENNKLTTGFRPPASDGDAVTRNSVTSGGITVRHVTALPLSPMRGNEAVDAKPTARKEIQRGLSAQIATNVLREMIWERTLLLANRFRVIRTIDVAVSCFAERPFKAALTAAQRAMRGIVKAKLLKRYRTDRFQTVYGLTQKGVDWLDARGREAASSVRRVSDMSNPEHRLWAQFIVLAAEARGLSALTEQELLQELNRGKVGPPMVQGLLKVSVTSGGSGTWMHLRPDAVCREQIVGGDQVDTTWFEVDRSRRGSNREAALGALAMRMGAKLTDGTRLRTLVVFARTERIEQRALSVVRNMAKSQGQLVLIEGRRHFTEVEPGVFAVKAFAEKKGGSRGQKSDTVVGHIIVQMLPTWLPKARVERDSTIELPGWFGENYLPHRRPSDLPNWHRPLSIGHHE